MHRLTREDYVVTDAVKKLVEVWFGAMQYALAVNAQVTG